MGGKAVTKRREKIGFSDTKEEKYEKYFAGSSPEEVCADWRRPGDGENLVKGRFDCMLLHLNDI